LLSVLVNHTVIKGTNGFRMMKKTDGSCISPHDYLNEYLSIWWLPNMLFFFSKKS